jgi:isoaspartyl peptidase/L-asparaginase-like protein (Ntn-hydrolase superfamily)
VTAGTSLVPVVVHGGVDSPGGTGVLRVLERAARAGERALAGRSDAAAAVEATVRVLEADPFFDADLGLLGRRRAIGGVVLFDAERDRIAVAHNAADFPVVAHDGEWVRLVDPVRLPGAWDG